MIPLVGTWKSGKSSTALCCSSRAGGNVGTLLMFTIRKAVTTAVPAHQTSSHSLSSHVAWRRASSWMAARREVHILGEELEDGTKSENLMVVKTFDQCDGALRT